MNLSISHKNQVKILKLRKKELIVYLLTLCLFLPSNIGSWNGVGKFFLVINNLAMLYVLFNWFYGIVRYQKLRYKPSLIITSAIIFYVVRIMLVYFHGGSYDLHNWTSTFKVIIAIIWFEKTAKCRFRNQDSMMWALWTWVILDSIFTIIWPEGSPILNGGYLLGWKNNKIEMLFMVNLFSLIKIEREKLNFKDSFFKKWIILSGFSILNSILADSATTMGLLVVICLFPLLKKFIKRGICLNPIMILIIHLILWYLIIINNQEEASIIGKINDVLFQRDATFTGRSYIWISAINLITKSWITGYVNGFQGYGTIKLTGSHSDISWLMAHNQILELFMQGGVILFLIFSFVILVDLFKNRKCNRGTLLARWAIFSLMFSYLTEAFTGSAAFINLILIYYATQWGYDARKLYSKK